MDTARLLAALPDDPAEIASLLQDFSCLVLLTCLVVLDLTEYQLVTYAGHEGFARAKADRLAKEGLQDGVPVSDGDARAAEARLDDPPLWPHGD